MTTDQKPYLVREITPFHFIFFSEGPKGRIIKAIEYQEYNIGSKNYFNLALGDLDEITGRIDYKVVSNNNDTDKVLATVAQSVMEFFGKHPTALIYATGSTPSRTRLYQINLSKIFPLISLSFDLQGFINDRWESFQKGKNYEAFSLRYKK